MGYHKIILKNDISILKQIVWEIKKWHRPKLSRPSGSEDIEENNILHIWPMTQEPCGLQKFNFHTAKTNVNILTLYDVNSEQHLININWCSWPNTIMFIS